MRTIVRAAAAAAVLAVVAAAPAAADWREPFDSASPINFDSARNGDTPSLADVGGRPTVAWVEDNTTPGAGNASVIRVAELNGAGTGWTRLDGDISRVSTASSYTPSVADVGGAPWVAWSENLDGTRRQIRVARPAAAGGWEHVGEGDRPINQTVDPEDPGNARDPVIVDGGDGRPYVVFFQFEQGTGSLFPDVGEAAPARVWVVRLNAARTKWERVGGGAVSLPAGDAGEVELKDAAFPDIAVVDGRVWVTYLQAALGPTGLVPLVRAARLKADGTGWEQVEPLTAPAGYGPDFRVPDVAAVGGAPMVAVNLAGGNGGRIFVARPRGDLSGWDAVAGGFASPQDAAGQDASLEEIGGTAWVAYRHRENQDTSGRAVRLAGDEWVPAGGPIRHTRDGLGDAPQLVGVAGLPWVAFTADDRRDPGEEGRRGCCNQVRAARLVPDFGAAGVYPAATTAAVLGAVETFGLDYPLRLETTPLGGSTVESVFKPLNASQALGELRDLAPATVHTVRASSTAGTPEKLYGPPATFVTPPAVETPATPAPAPVIAPTTIVQAPRAAAVLGILRSPDRVRRGRTLRLVLLGTEGGTAEFVARRSGRTARRFTRTVKAGRFSMSWKPSSRLARGVYRVTVTIRTADGRIARDAISVRIVR
jgi:hypothetical protein